MYQSCVTMAEGYRFARLDEVPEYKQYETPPSNATVADAARTQFAQFTPPKKVK